MRTVFFGDGAHKNLSHRGYFSRGRSPKRHCTQRGGGFARAGGSQMFGRATHLKISTKVSAGIHPRSRKTARCVQVYFSLLFLMFSFHSSISSLLIQSKSGYFIQEYTSTMKKYFLSSKIKFSPPCPSLKSVIK